MTGPNRESRHRTRKMGGHARRGDEHRAAAVLGIEDIVAGRGGGSVCGAHPHFVPHAERVQHFERGLDHREIGIRSHEHCNEGRLGHHGHTCKGQEFLRRRGRRGGAASISRLASSRPIRAGSRSLGTRTFFLPSVIYGP